MKPGPRVCALALAIGLPFAAAHEPPPSGDAEMARRQEMQKEVDEAVDAIRSYSVERRNDAVAQAGQAMEDADRRMDRLQLQVNDRWERMDAAARQRSQTAMAELRQRRSDLAEWTGGMKHSSKGAWEEVKAGFIHSYRDFTRTMDRARAQFDRDAPPAPSPEKTSSEKQREEER